MRTSVRTNLGLVIVLLLACCPLTAQLPAHRIPQPIDESLPVTLAGNVHPLARPEFDQGAVVPETPLNRMLLALAPSAAQQAQLDALVAAQHDPASPLYHRWLTPAEYAARFGASPRNLALVTAWLTQHGFTIEEVPAGGSLIVFSGTAGQVFDAFHTEIHRYRINGDNHIANSQDPQIPFALAGVISGIVSLNDFHSVSEIAARRPLAATASHPLYTAGSTHYLFPADFATIYDLNPLYTAGTTGAGTLIAVIGRSNINLSDVAAFRSASALAVNPPTVILSGSDPGLVPSDQVESTLDVEWAGAVAPAAAVKLVAAASTATTDGIDLAAEYAVNHGLAPVLSLSYGNCEHAMGAAELAFYNSLWQQAASQGISVFVASGDSGAAGCSAASAASGSGVAVNGMCSSPYSTCVGGTEFDEGSNPAQYWSASNGAGSGSARGYIPEEVWNESAANGGSGLWASGGGISAVYTQPGWQAEAGGAAVANGMRAVPDVALPAADHDGYIAYENGAYQVISGTSAAAPSFAALMALVIENQGGAGQGNANAGLYPLLNAAANPFHATPSGSNSVPGVAGYTAGGAAYNPATGLGSVDGSLLVSNWGAASGSGHASLDFALTASATSGTVVAGNSASFSLRVIESGSAASEVAVSASAPAGVAVTIQPSILLPGSPAVATVAVSAGAAAGPQNITFTASDASGNQSIVYTLTVLPAPTLALTSAPGTVALVQGGIADAAFTASTGGSFFGNISFSIAGLPSGVTVASPAFFSISASGAATVTTMLTFRATALTRIGSTEITVTVAGDGLVATRSLTLQISRPQACASLLHTSNSRCSPLPRNPARRR